MKKYRKRDLSPLRYVPGVASVQFWEGPDETPVDGTYVEVIWYDMGDEGLVPQLEVWGQAWPLVVEHIDLFDWHEPLTIEAFCERLEAAGFINVDEGPIII